MSRIDIIGQNGPTGDHYHQDYDSLEMRDELGGRKYDKGKIRMELIPPELLEEVGKILTFGANKYSDRNWEAGLEWGRVYGALLRHLTSWWSGEDKDKETNESHLSHAACCLSFLIAYEQRGVGRDDRPCIRNK